MRQFYLLILLVLLSVDTTRSQECSFKDFLWIVKDASITVPDKYRNENEVVLERNIKVEIAAASGSAVQFLLFHEKTFINSDDAIERNNKVYVPHSEEDKVLKNKLRVILKNGKVINLKESDIKEEIDQERGVKYHYFAVNGLEKGAVIERYYLLKENPKLDGRTFQMQGAHPIVKNTFELVHPQHLAFQYKSYNGLPEAAVDTTSYSGKYTVGLQDTDIAALKNDEKYSNYNRHLKAFRYKLSANLASGTRNMYNYNEFATTIFDRFNPKFEKKDQKALEDFCKSFAPSKDLQEQIWDIENKIKKTIAYSPYFDTKGGLADILKSKQANQSEILLLYLAVFRQMKIEHQIVFTSNRYEKPYDRDFQSFENLNEILFYFPAIKMYLTPTEIEYRLPLFPDEYGNTHGLFVRAKHFGGMEMGVGEVRFIELPDAAVTRDLMEITVDFTRDITNPTISSKMTYGGYSAVNFQPIKDFVDQDRFNKIMKEIAENYIGEAEYKSLKTENDGTDHIGKKPYILHLTYDGSHLVQKAGTNYLFQVGQIIGRQMELYQEMQRALPVEIDHPHSYARKITILLPEKIQVKNPEKVAMQRATDINGKTEASWTSTYKMEGGAFVIENTEYYNSVEYPLDVFASYKDVINAAADFNKLVLVLN